VAPPSTPVPVRFGVFQVNLAAGELRKHGVRIRIAGQPLEILAILLEKPGEVVTRDELRAKLWSGNTFVDFEHSLNKAVNRLRQVLSDSAEKPLYIETLPRIGYRFIAPVTELRGASDVVNAAVQQQPPPATLRRDRRLASWVIYALVGVTLVSGSLYLAQRWWVPRQQPQGRAKLAVLPFQNLSGNPDEDYFSDGLTEEMIAQLGRIDPERLGVIARTSVMHYKHSQEQLEQIGRELGVQYVLEGSVRRESGKVRITAQLIQMKDQTHIWTRQYDRELSHLLVLQGEIALEIAHEIELTFGEHKRIEPARQPPLSPNAFETYDLYLRGRYFWNKRTAPDFQRAAEYFQQAIAKDPNYARAYAGLADSYALMSSYNFVPQNEFMPKARAAALRALQIDDSLAEAHTSLALIVQNYDWDWQTAEKEYRRAIELDPNYATAHQWYAEHLAWLGRFDEAFAESERAHQLDPLSLIIATDNGAILYFSRQYDRAIAQFRAVLDMEPNFPRASIVINAYIEKGLFADALAEIEKKRRVSGDQPWIWSTLAFTYGRAGQPAQARRALKILERLNRRQQTNPAAIVWAYIGVGNKDQAFACLEKAYSQHFGTLTTLKVDPGYDSLRSDPRFQDLLQRVHLAP
jgi:TolB-like protein/DNA-binding winged helix-turn-helix (wHTH) protein/Tfp pilus assembly protein PilF